MYGLRDSYDLVFSIGESCTCSEALRRCGFQYQSFPFDWISAFDLTKHVMIMAGGFADLLVEDRLRFLGENAEGSNDEYVDEKWGTMFIHDFPPRTPLKDSFGMIREKYDRRIQRLLKHLAAAKSSLAVYVQIPSRDAPSDDELAKAWKILHERFPTSGLDLLCVCSLPDVRFDPHNLRQVCQHVFRIGFDIRMPPGSSQFISNRKALIPAFKALVRSVSDSRTPEERQAWERIVREKKYRAMHASSWLEYAVNRFNWLMFRHFRNRLERMGFENLSSHRAQ